MAKDVRAEITFQGGMLFRGVSDRSGATVEIDFAAEGQPLAGFTPLELLMTSLCGCSGQVVVGLLKRMGQEVESLTVRVRGQKREVHPTILTSIEMEFEFRGGKLDPASVEKAMELSEDRYCPVWVMLKASAPIKAAYKILAA